MWLNSDNKLKTSTDIGRIIYVELPNSALYPRFCGVVSSYKMHGSCGFYRHKSPCMKDGK